MRSKALAYLRTSSSSNVGPDKDSEQRQLAAISIAKRLFVLSMFLSPCFRVRSVSLYAADTDAGNFTLRVEAKHKAGLIAAGIPAFVWFYIERSCRISAARHRSSTLSPDDLISGLGRLTGEVVKSLID